MHTNVLKQTVNEKNYEKTECALAFILKKAREFMLDQKITHRMVNAEKYNIIHTYEGYGHDLMCLFKENERVYPNSENHIAENERKQEKLHESKESSNIPSKCTRIG